MMQLIVMMLLVVTVAIGAQVHCDGTGTAPPVERLSTNALAFGDVDLGLWAEQPFTIYNDGGRTLIDSVGVGPLCDADFTLRDGENRYELAPGDSAQIWVRFTPSSLGPKTCDIVTIVLSQ